MASVLIGKNNKKSESFKVLLQDKRIAFWLMMLGFMARVFVRNVFTVEFPVLLLLVYVCTMSLFCDSDEIIALAISFVPFSAAFQSRYALLALMVVYLLKFPKSVKKLSAFVPLILLMVWELFHVFCGVFSVPLFLKGFSELLFLSFVISLGKKEFDFSFISRVFSVSVAFCCSVLMLKLLDQVNYDFLSIFSDGGYRLGIFDEEVESYVMNYNANALGFMCNMAIAGVVLKIKKDGMSWFDALLVFALAFFGLLTLSRAFIICFVCLGLLSIVGYGRNLNEKTKTLIVVSGAIAIIILIVNSIAPYVFDNILKRFGEEDVSNGRNELFVEYFDFIFSSLSNALFGIGLQDGLAKVHDQGFTHIALVPHNAIQELVVVWGIPGLLLFACFLMYMVLESKTVSPKRNFISFIPIILMLTMVQTTQLITSGNRLMMLPFIYLALTTDFSVHADINKTEQL